MRLSALAMSDVFCVDALLRTEMKKCFSFEYLSSPLSIHRLLKPGGGLALSDVVLRESAPLWVRVLGGGKSSKYTFMHTHRNKIGSKFIFVCHIYIYIYIFIYV